MSVLAVPVIGPLSWMLLQGASAWFFVGMRGVFVVQQCAEDKELEPSDGGDEKRSFPDLSAGHSNVDEVTELRQRRG